MRIRVAVLFIAAVALILAVAIILAPRKARSQEGRLGHGHDAWHAEFYSRLLRPDTKTSCCNLSDCRPTSGRTLAGRYQVKVNGAWVSVPASKIIREAAPDGGFHVCAPVNFDGTPENLYCVILAPEG